MARRTWEGLEPAPDSPPPPSPPPRRPRWTPVCGGLLLVAVGVFLADAVGGGMHGGLGEALLLYGPLVQERQYWRLLGYALVHGNLLHLLLNMSAVYTLGFMLERGLGTVRFVLVSLVSCLGAAVLVLVLDFEQATVGASGMILGWMGAMLPLATREGRRDLGVTLLQVAVISLLPGVSFAGHLGGFLFGGACGLALRRGPRVFSLAAPVLLFLTALAALVAAHPDRWVRWR